MNGKAKRFKIIIVIVTLLVLVLSGEQIAKTPLKERGVVVGLGLDKKDGKILLLAQIILSGESSTPGSASAYDVLEGSGETLGEAFNDLAKKEMLIPSYAHCNILFIGKALLEDGFEEVMTKLFESNRIKDNTQLVVTEDAKDAITTLVPISSTPSEYMEKEIKITAENGGRSIVSLKDYLQRKDITSGSRYLSYAVKLPANAPTGENTSKADKEVFLFDLSNTAVFDLDGNVHYYGKDITEGIGFVEANGGSVTYREDDKYLTVEILKAIKLRDYDKDPAKVISHYTYFARISEQTLEDSVNKLDLAKVEELIASTIKEKIRYSYTKAKADNVDLFSLIGRLYKRYGVKYELNEIEWDIDIKVVLR